MNIRKQRYLEKEDRKRRQGLLRDSDGAPVVNEFGQVVTARAKIKNRSDLVHRMIVSGYKIGHGAFREAN